MSAPRVTGGPRLHLSTGRGDGARHRADLVAMNAAAATGPRTYLGLGSGIGPGTDAGPVQVSDAMKLYLSTTGPGEHRSHSASQVGAAVAGVLPPGARLRLLFSYWYYRKADLTDLLVRYFDPAPDLFADSGAFSAYSLGGAVDVDEYADWLLRFAPHFTAYANLDVKGDWRAGLRNQAHLERRGLAPLPVFHGGEPWELLDDLCTTYPYVALGGMAGTVAKGDALMRWLLRCFEVARARDAVLHGFGITTWTILKAFPWYSVDSTSWGSGFRYGRANVFDGRAGRFVQLALGSRAAWHTHGALVRSYGFDPAAFARDNRNYDRTALCALSALSYLRAEAWLRRRHGPIPLPARAPDPRGAAGLKLYLSDAAGGDNHARAAHGLGVAPQADRPFDPPRAGPAAPGRTRRGVRAGATP